MYTFVTCCVLRTLNLRNIPNRSSIPRVKYSLTFSNILLLLSNILLLLSNYYLTFSTLTFSTLTFSYYYLILRVFPLRSNLPWRNSDQSIIQWRFEHLLYVCKSHLVHKITRTPTRTPIPTRTPT